MKKKKIFLWWWFILGMMWLLLIATIVSNSYVLGGVFLVFLLYGMYMNNEMKNNK